jgi:hypothetical protein
MMAHKADTALKLFDSAEAIDIPGSSQMPSPNRIVLACAGSGKTTSIMRDACDDDARSAALVTYTINGAEVLRKVACAHAGATSELTLPKTVERPAALRAILGRAPGS